MQQLEGNNYPLEGYKLVCKLHPMTKLIGNKQNGLSQHINQIVGGIARSFKR